MLLLAVLCAAVASGPAARAAPRAPGDDAPAAAPGTQAAYLASRLRENPVYLSDQVPRSVPRSSAPAYAKQARRTGVPTYVVLLPGRAVGVRGEALLAAVHDRLGRDGLYVLLDESGISNEAATFGVDVPAQDAIRATLYELPSDAGPLRAFTHFVDVLTAGEREAAHRARSAAEKYGGSEEPDDFYLSDTDREDQSVLTGTLLSGVPVLILLLGRLVRRRRPGLRGARLRYVAPLALTSALVVGVGASQMFDETRSSADPPPTAHDLAARTDRVADGLRRGPVYVDPESATGLGPARRAALSRHIGRLGVPVRIAVVPTETEDESAGDGDLFAAGLHKALRRDAVYVVAAPDGETYEVVNYGAELDDEQLHRYTEPLRYARGAGGEDEPPDLYRQLDALLTHIDDTRAGPPGRPWTEPSPADDPVAEETLPPLWSGSLWGGTVLGVLAALLVWGLTAGVWALVRHRRGRAGDRGGRIGTVRAKAITSAGRTDAPEAPARPGTGWLRRTARRELDELNAEFGRSSEAATDAARSRAWNCLDAATLLLDQESDGRIDADADPPTLAAAVVLLRAGHAALTGKAPGGPPGAAGRLCSLNPLHGPAAGNRKFEREGTARARTAPVCADCRAALSGQGRRSAARERLLRLRAGQADPYVPYDRLPGPLGASSASTGGLTIDHLIDHVREYLGVH